jgi:beta-glucosidase
MSLAEKVGQMTLVEKNSLRPGDVATYYLGGVLSGGGGSPRSNTPAAWLEMVNGFQEEALATPLAIPILYGVDAVHGHNNVAGAVIFPHNIGLGATRNPELVREDCPRHRARGGGDRHHLELRPRRRRAPGHPLGPHL